MAVLHFDGCRDTGQFRYHVTNHAQGSEEPTLFQTTIVTGRKNTTFGIIPSTYSFNYNPLYTFPLINQPSIVSSGCAWQYINTSWPEAALISIGDVFLYLSPIQNINNGNLLPANSCGIFYRTGTTTATLLASTTVPAGISTFTMINSWNYWELKVDRVANQIQVRLNENLIINHNIVNANALAGLNHSCTICAYSPISQIGTQTAWCDWYVASGDFLGDCRVEVLPASADAQQQWTTSSGTSNFALIDEFPANTADYVSSQTTGVTDLYSHAIDIGDNIQSILGVRVSSSARPSGGLEYPAKRVANVIKSGSTTATGTFTPPRCNLNINSTVWETNPNTSTAWTKADITALQFGVKLDSQ